MTIAAALLASRGTNPLATALVSAVASKAPARHNSAPPSMPGQPLSPQGVQRFAEARRGWKVTR